MFVATLLSIVRPTLRASRPAALAAARRALATRMGDGDSLPAGFREWREDDAPPALDADYAEAVFASSLLVQDPLSPKFSNVSGTAFRWAVVQTCFREALGRLHEALREALHARDAGGGAPRGGEGALLAALLDEGGGDAGPSVGA